MNARPAGAAIAGLGMTELGKVFGRSPRRLAAEAVRLAAADAGLALAEIDGLLVCPGISGQPGTGLARDLGLRDLRLLSQVNALGASAGVAVSIATMAVLTGTATAVACVFADAPRRQGAPAGAAFGAAAPAREPGSLPGLAGLSRAFGFGNVTAHYTPASGELGPGGSLPVNTGGGQLSGYYMWGFTPLSEAVIQARGDGGERQSTRTDTILVSGNGGILDHHATLILSPHTHA